MAQAAAAESGDALAIECRSCGARLQVAAGERTAVCPYCDSPSVVTRPPTADRPAPRYVLGFAIDEARARRAVADWIRRRGPFAHSGLRSASIDRTRGVYLPAYLYGATARTAFSAEIGEDYQVRETYWTRDAKGRRVRRTRVVTRTEWRPLAGRHASYVHDVVVSASGGVPNREIEAIEPFDLRSLTRFRPAMIAGWAAEEPSRTVDDCRATARSEAEALVARRLPAFLPGDHWRNLRHRLHLEHEFADLLLLPVWSFALDYAEGRPPLRILVNGQTGKAAGHVPLSPGKIVLAVALAAALAAGLFFLWGAR